MGTEGKEVPKVEKKAGRLTIMIGLMLGVLLFALDQTVVGTSIYKISSSLNGFEHMAWIFTAYMLTSTIVIPLSGKVSDLIGRKPVFLTGMIIFLTGSVLCGFAGSFNFLGISGMVQLILFRGLQGLGGGMVFPVAIATIADLYAPAERGKIQGAMGGVWGLSSILGPFLGGWIVDYMHIFGVASWRWVFFVNVPVGIAAITMISIFFPRLKKHGTPPIDYIGAALITGALLPLLLITVWGGDQYPWLSWQIFGLGIISAVCLGLFLFVETKAKDPIIPLQLFKEPVFSVAAVVGFIMGMGMFGVITFMPTYFQGVVGMTATYSGAVLIPLTATMVIGSVSSGMLMKRAGYKIFIVSGALFVAMGMLWLSQLGTSPPIWLAVVGMMICGLGMGFGMQTLIVAIQNVVVRHLVGTGTSTMVLIRSLGSTIGVTVLGTILNRRFEHEFDSQVPKPMQASLLANPMIDGHKDRIPQLLSSDAFLKAAPPAVIDGIKVAFSNSISLLFLISFCLALLAFIVALFLKSVPLKSMEEYNANTHENREKARKDAEKKTNGKKKAKGKE